MRTHIETVRQPRRRARNDVIHLGSRNKQQLDELKTGLNLPGRSLWSPVGLAVSALLTTPDLRSIVPRKPLPRTCLNLLCFDGRLVTTAASSGRRPRVKHRNNQPQNTKR